MNTLDKKKQEEKPRQIARIAAVNAMDSSTDAFYDELFSIFYDLKPFKKIQDIEFPEYIDLSIKVAKLEQKKMKQIAEEWLLTRQKEGDHDIDMNLIFDVLETCYMIGAVAIISSVIIDNKNVS